MKSSPKEQLKQSLVEMKKIREGKLPKITWEEFKNELKKDEEDLSSKE